jgi:uncharacterized protein (TIGR03435 family)
MAYGLRDYQLEGPEWLRTQNFDVVAKFPEALPKDREKYNTALHAMMQRMLADRFKLTFHRDQKILPVYALMVGKSGLKFKEVPDGDSHSQNTDDHHYEGKCVSMEAFATTLSQQMDLPVLNMTGLKKFYDVKLDWMPESHGQRGKGRDGELNSLVFSHTRTEPSAGRRDPWAYGAIG